MAASTAADRLASLDRRRGRVLFVYDGSAGWSGMTSTALQNMALLGVGTNVDAANLVFGQAQRGALDSEDDRRGRYR